MNMTPDETTLALWLDDELTGAELAAVEEWALNQPEQIAARDEVRRWRATMAAAIPAAEEPPYPEFFNSRIMREIREGTPKPLIVAERSFSWRSWVMPLAACAGMVLAFAIGRKSGSAPDYDVANAPRAIPVEPVVYTPESGVNAEWFASTKASATVIVLKGLAAIPDTLDLSATVSAPMERESDFTADVEGQPEFKTGTR